MTREVNVAGRLMKPGGQDDPRQDTRSGGEDVIFFKPTIPARVSFYNNVSK